MLDWYPKVGRTKPRIVLPSPESFTDITYAKRAAENDVSCSRGLFLCCRCLFSDACKNSSGKCNRFFYSLSIFARYFEITKFLVRFVELKINVLENVEVEKAKTFIVVEIIEYVPNSVVIKTIVKKTTGDVSVVSIDTGEGLTEKISPFDTFIQVIDGKAEVVINDSVTLMAVGQAIIIPAHARSTIRANERFKMISTVIKSGYE